MYMYIPVCIHCLAQINLAYTYMLAIVPSSKFSLMSAKKCSTSCMSLLNLHRPCISVHYIRYDWQAPSWELNLYQIDFYIVWNNGWIIHNTPPTFWTWKPLQLSMQKELSLQLTVFFFRFRWVSTIHYYVEENYMTHSQPNFINIIIPSWQLTVSMHLISSLICNEHDKLMAKMTILFLLYGCTAWFSYKWPIVMYNTLHLYDGSKLTTCILNYVPNSVVCKNLPVPRIYWSSSH